MIKMYPLEWFDSLILNTFDAYSGSVFKLSKSEADMLCERIKSESKRIKIQIKESVFELKNKRHIRQLVRKYHSSFVFLLDSIMEISKRNSFRGPDLAMVFDLIIFSFNDLLSFIETRYYSHISLDQRIPLTYLAVWRAEMVRNFKELLKKNAASDEEDELKFAVNILICALDESSNSKFTYRQILYYRELLFELEKLDDRGSKNDCFSALDMVLIRLNFNNQQYAERLTGKVEQYLDNFTNLADKLENIIYCWRSLSKINSNLKLSFNPSLRNLATLLENWFSSEIRFIEKKIKISALEENGFSPAGESLVAADSRLQCILSGDQIGLILRATDEARIIKSKSMNYLFKSVVPYLSTPARRNLSYQSVRSKSYNAEQRDKDIAIESLEKIIRKIKTY